MAVGWAGEGVVSQQISDSINDEVERARQSLPKGQSLTECELCGEAITEGRRQALPGVRLCVACQRNKERLGRPELFNRRGSKDSQLR